MDEGGQAATHDRKPHQHSTPNRALRYHRGHSQCRTKRTEPERHTIGEDTTNRAQDQAGRAKDGQEWSDPIGFSGRTGWERNLAVAVTLVGDALRVGYRLVSCGSRC